MPGYKIKFKIALWHKYSFGIMFEDKKLFIGLIKWTLVIGLFKHYDKIPF